MSLPFTKATSLFYGSLFLAKRLPELIFRPNVYKLKERKVAPPLLRDASFGEHKFVQLPSSKIKLHYVSAGDVNKPLLMFVHGFPDCWLSWRNQIIEFSKDYWVVAPDLRGFGESDKPLGIDKYHLDDVSNDLRELIHHLGKKPILVSHDFGGAASWHLLRQNSSEAVAHIGVNSPDGRTFTKAIATNREQFKKAWYVFFFRNPLLPELALRRHDLRFIDNYYEKFCSREEIECLKYYFSQPGALTSALNYYRAFRSSKVKVNSTITTPTLIIWGVNDQALESDLAIRAKSFVKNLQIEMISNCGHWAHQENPSRVNELIRSYLNTLFEKNPS